jgi:chromosome segregation ATPase
MDNDLLYKKKYLKYKEKFLFLQQIAAGYQKQKDFTQKKTQQQAKIDSIQNNINSTKETVKNAVNAELSALEAYNKNVDDKNALKTLNQNKNASKQAKNKLESMTKTLFRAKDELRNITIKERRSREKVAENNVSFANKAVIAKKKEIKSFEKKIEKINAQLKKTNAEFESAKAKEVEAAAKLEEMRGEFAKVEQDGLAKLDADSGGGSGNSSPSQ